MHPKRPNYDDLDYYPGKVVRMPDPFDEEEGSWSFSKHEAAQALKMLKEYEAYQIRKREQEHRDRVCKIMVEYGLDPNAPGSEAAANELLLEIGE